MLLWTFTTQRKCSLFLYHVVNAAAPKTRRTHRMHSTVARTSTLREAGCGTSIPSPSGIPEIFSRIDLDYVVNKKESNLSTKLYIKEKKLSGLPGYGWTQPKTASVPRLVPGARQIHTVQEHIWDWCHRPKEEHFLASSSYCICHQHAFLYFPALRMFVES